MLVDSVLSTLYRHVGRRPIMLSSESRDVCIMMSLKQPKFPVFFVSTAKDSQSSIQGSLKFCNEHLLLGMFIPHWILEDAPVLPKAIQESGLVVIACNRENSGQLIPCDQASATKDLVDGTCNTGVVFVNTKSVSHNPDEYFAWARRFHEYQVETLEGSRLPDVNNICISQSAIDPPRTGDMAATKDSSMLTSHSEPRGNSNLDPLAFSLTDAKPMSNSILNGESVIQNRNPASILDFLRK
ncbi:hypothetical protein SARC_00056 [Sphaeroforma arctica JP610]|uniref:Uncharacterized protein n=1 Tax=Sphaeroforma arctica JP610 TaxID=667725 RepID=A0A0L0GG11_9EUKA|nr:hypothetical protein SARC_00056 [Sphaeroforma arctica JP610]KNC87799.1 hypothetical protein SARC_00056 [Sphaeroforma arctica JP610]|eukprot:XP_014161701.1 hypothetical protein SARC_00056 [Sphaeroforma arctica JP610]